MRKHQTQSQPGEFERGDAGRGGRTSLARPKCQARTFGGQRKYRFSFHVQLTTSKIDNYARSTHTLFVVSDVTIFLLE